MEVSAMIVGRGIPAVRQAKKWNSEALAEKLNIAVSYRAYSVRCKTSQPQPDI